MNIKRPALGGVPYILPNLLTTGNIFFGFFSVIKTLSGDFRWAALAIVLAAVFDVLDGRVARLTGGTSEFGVHYDSLCDLVSFGVAPALLMFQFALVNIGRPGWIICSLFLICGALRLARFNVQSDIGKADGDFTGLPIPMAAAVVATFVATVVEFQNYGPDRHFIIRQISYVFQQKDFAESFLTIMGPLLAVMMVSNFAYRSHKVIKVNFVKPFRLLVLLVLLLLLVAYEPELLGFIFVFFYAISGPIEWVLGWKKTIDEDDIFTPLDENESAMEPK